MQSAARSSGRGAAILRWFGRLYGGQIRETLRRCAAVAKSPCRFAKGVLSAARSTGRGAAILRCFGALYGGQIREMVMRCAGGSQIAVPSRQRRAEYQ